MFILFLIVFINLVGFGIIIPLLPFYGEHYGASPDQVTLLMAIYSLAQFITAPVWGRLSDKYGRRPVLLFSLAGTAIAYVWLALASDLTSLYLARAWGGLMAGSIAAAFAYMADITSEEDRAKSMGLLGAAFGLGFIAGPAIGGLLAGSDPAVTNFALPSYAAAGFSAAALLLAVFILQESLAPEIRAAIVAKSAQQRWVQFTHTMSRSDVRTTIILTFMSVFVFAGLEATFALWSGRTFGWGVAQNGYVFAYTGIISALVQGGLVGRMSRRWGEPVLIKQGFVALGIGLLIIPLSNNLVILLIAMAVVAYGFSLCSPALASQLSLQVSKEEQGAIQGIGRSASTLARVLGPAGAGYIFTFAGKDWPFYVGAALMAVILFFSLAIGDKTAKATKSP
ncbi:MAG: MFS transporter [Rhodospirillales bacterium]|nr:MFS transporter [Rhodospirillales bacterium]